MAAPIPLTTTFTPAPACLTNIHWASSAAWYVLGEYNTACLPHASNTPLANPTLSPYYSPAAHCPSGFTVACSSTSGSETIATCCPQVTGVPLLSKTSFSCYTDQPNWGAWSSYGCVAAIGTLATQGPLTIVATDSNGIAATTTTRLNNTFEGVNAFSVQIRWHASDLPALATATSSSSASSSSSSSSSNTITNAATTSSSPSSANSTAPTPTPTPALTNPTTPVSSSSSTSSSTTPNLPPGIIAAIAVIASLLLLLAAGVTAIFLLRRHRAKPRNATSQARRGTLPPVQAMSNPLYEIGDKAGPEAWMRELPGR